MRRLDKHDVQEIRSRCIETLVGGGSFRATAKELASVYNVDISRIYHYTKDLRPGRKKRTDSGARKAISQDDYMALAKLTVDYDFAATTLERKGSLNGIEFNAATFRRYLREDRMSRRDLKKDLEPWRRWEARYSNDYHQLDTTVAQQFYLDDDGSFGYEKSWSVNKNRPGNRKPRLTLAQLKDDHSRVVYAEFILGNNTLAWMKFLYRAWKKKTGAFPFFGLPKALYSDNDSVIKSEKFVYAMHRLKVEVRTHMPGNSRAKGKVESGFKVLQEFEKMCKLVKFKSLEEANAYLWNELLYWNNKIHGSTGEKPFVRWTAGLNGEPRMVPDQQLYETLCLNFDKSLIYNNITIKKFGKTFQLPRKRPFINYVQQMVDIAWHPENENKIWVILDNKDYEIDYAPVDVHEAGEFRAVATPDYLKLRKQVQETDISHFDITKQETDFPDYHVPEGKAFEDTQARTIDPMASKFVAIGMLQDEDLFSKPLTPTQDDLLEQLFAGRPEIPRSEVEQFIEKYKTHLLKVPEQQVVSDEIKSIKHKMRELR